MTKWRQDTGFLFVYFFSFKFYKVRQDTCANLTQRSQSLMRCSAEVNLLRMRLALGWGTAAKSPWRLSVIRFFFKLDFIFYFVWPLKAIFLFSFYVKTAEQTGSQEILEYLCYAVIPLMKYSFCAKYRNVHSGTHKYIYEARSRTSVENSSYL